jgi:hypothetical protein
MHQVHAMTYHFHSAAEALLKLRYDSPVARTLIREASNTDFEKNHCSPNSKSCQLKNVGTRQDLTSSPPSLVQARSSSPMSEEHIPSSPRKSSPIDGHDWHRKPMKILDPSNQKPITFLGQVLSPGTAPSVELFHTSHNQLRDHGASSSVRDQTSIVQLQNNKFSQSVFPSQGTICSTDPTVRLSSNDTNRVNLGSGNIFAAIHHNKPEVTLSRGICPGVHSDFTQAGSNFGGGDIFAALRERGTIFATNENKDDILTLRRRVEQESSNNAWYRSRLRVRSEDSEGEELGLGSDGSDEE